MNTTISKPVQNAQEWQSLSVQKGKLSLLAPKSSSISLGNLPERKIRAGAISATVWLNKGQKENGEESEYRTVSIERNYKDKGGEWKSSNSMRVTDLPKAVIALQRAYEHLVLHEQDLFKGGY